MLAQKITDEWHSDTANVRKFSNWQFANIQGAKHRLPHRHKTHLFKTSKENFDMITPLFYDGLFYPYCNDCGWTQLQMRHSN